MKKFFIILLALTVSIISCNKDDEDVKADPKWTIYDGTNGLINSTAISVACDLNGKVFIGQADGVTTYDNGVFQQYPMDESSFYDLHLDKQGNMWGGVHWEDLMKFENDTWIVPNDEISNIIDIKDGENNTIWFCSDGHILVEYDGTNWMQHQIPDSLVRSDGRLICTYEDHNAKLWVGSWDGLYSLDGDTWEVYDLVPDYYTERVQCLLVADNGDLYVSIYYNGVKKFDGNTWTEVEDLPHVWIKSMYQSTNGDIWFGTAYAGVARYTGTEMITYQDEFYIDGYVNDITQATDGSMWVLGVQQGDAKHGVARLSDWE